MKKTPTIGFHHFSSANSRINFVLDFGSYANNPEPRNLQSLSLLFNLPLFFLRGQLIMQRRDRRRCLEGSPKTAQTKWWVACA